MYHRFLMAPPGAFDPHFIGNPWTTWDRVPDPDRARRQWETLVLTLRSAGSEVHCLEVEGEPGAMTFTADGALVYTPGKAVVLRNDGPRGEIEPPFFRQWLATAGYLVEALPPAMRLDGGNIVAAGPGVWLVGVKPGSDGRAERYLGRLLRRLTGATVYGIPLVGRRFLHLDMVLSGLGGRAWLLYPGALADGGAALRAAPWFRGRPVVEAAREDAHAFACNAVVLDDLVVTGPVSGALRGALRGLGVEVECLDLGEFYAAGGGAKCLTLPLDPPRWEGGTQVEGITVGAGGSEAAGRVAAAGGVPARPGRVRAAVSADAG